VSTSVEEDTQRVTEVLGDWRTKNLRYVRFELPDVHGTSRSKLVPIEHALGYATHGLNMYGGAGVLDTRSDVVSNTLYNEEVGYGDQRLRPDPDTAAVIPWVEATGRFICDSTWDDGRPLAALPRHVFRRVLERCREMGYEPVMGFEPEFYLLQEETRQPLFEGYHIFNTTRNTYTPFIQLLLDHMRVFGIDIITANCEYAGSQWEINFSPGVGMAGPDAAFTFKNSVKELAHGNGLMATFMSKPFSDSAGSGCHTHVSLQDAGSGTNAFGDDKDANGMSEVCRQFIAGQLAHARSIYALLAPTLNCLKRRRTHTFSPTNISWGLEDRSAFVRVKGGSVASKHVENRAPTGLSNPYLAGAAVLGAGLLGIENELELESPAQMPAEEDDSKEPLPTSVREGLEGLQSDKRIVDLLGEEFVTAYTTMRLYELQRFDDHVTDWETTEYMEVY
jgi:glutamine synthetase